MKNIATKTPKARKRLEICAKICFEISDPFLSFFCDILLYFAPNFDKTGAVFRKNGEIFKKKLQIFGLKAFLG